MQTPMTGPDQNSENNCFSLAVDKIVNEVRQFIIINYQILLFFIYNLIFITNYLRFLSLFAFFIVFRVHCSLAKSEEDHVVLKDSLVQEALK